jgi:hypothetical protein
MTDESQDCLLDAVGIHQRRRGFRDDDARRLVSMPGGQLAGEAHAHAEAAGGPAAWASIGARELTISK